EAEPRQLSLFSGQEADETREEAAAKERRQQEAILAIREKFGKNAVFKAMDLQEAATARARNEQVGGHKA
ncbi:MAG: type VI secretion protein ImpB, partial [Schwartzia sp.]|nr:type VI secretion protein ImpB [Schwartzia sp. (in: firmicutes)]